MRRTAVKRQREMTREYAHIPALFILIFFIFVYVLWQV